MTPVKSWRARLLDSAQSSDNDYFEPLQDHIGVNRAERGGVPGRCYRWVTTIMPLRLGFGDISGVWALYMKDNWLHAFLSALIQGGAWNPAATAQILR